MEFLLDLASLLATLLAVEGLTAVLRCSRLGLLPRSVCRLLAATGLGTLAAIVLAAWPSEAVAAPPPFVEAWSGDRRLGLPLAGLAGLGLGHVLGRLQGTFCRAANWRSFASLALAWPLLLWPCCFAPPWGMDAALYHLSLPLQQLLGYGPVPGHGNAGFFQLGERMALWPLAWGSWPAARAVPLLVLVWASQATWALRPQLHWGRAVAAQALFVASPAVIWQLGTAYVDVTLACLEGVSLLLLWRWHVAPKSEAAPVYLLASAWLAGSAVATKSMALAHVMGWWLGTGLSLRKQGDRQAAPPVALLWGAGLCQLLPVAVDVARNLYWFHAPLFPFGTAWWPGAQLALLPSQRAVLAAFLADHGPRWAGEALQGPWALLALPWALVFAAAFSSAKFDGVVGPLPLLAAACWLGRLGYRRRWAGPQGRSQRSAVRGQCGHKLTPWVAGYVTLTVGVWLSTSWQARFLLGPLWWCAWLVAGEGLHFSRHRILSWTALLAAFVTVASFWPSLGGHGPFWDARAFGSPPARRALRLEAVPASRLVEAPAVGGRLALVWTQRLLLWCMGPAASDSYDEAARLEQALRARPGDPQQAARLLRQDGIAALVVDEALLATCDPGADWAVQAAHAALLRDWRRLVATGLVEEGRVGTVVRYRLPRSDVAP